MVSAKFSGAYRREFMKAKRLEVRKIKVQKRNNLMLKAREEGRMEAQRGRAGLMLYKGERFAKKVGAKFDIYSDGKTRKRKDRGMGIAPFGVRI